MTTNFIEELNDLRAYLIGFLDKKEKWGLERFYITDCLQALIDKWRGKKMNYEKLEKDLTDFFNIYPDATDCIEDTVHDIILMVKENEV